MGLLALGALIGGVAGFRRAPTALSSEPATTAASTPLVTFEVHVAGWVVRPGVVTVGDGAIVADVIEAAGGMRSGARPDLVNLAEPVQPGQQVVLPGPEAGPGAATGASDGLISLNRADASTLETLPGVGPVLAERIVAYREQNGPFQQVEGLLQVPGIGEAKLASLRDLVTVP